MDEVWLAKVKRNDKVKNNVLCNQKRKCSGGMPLASRPNIFPSFCGLLPCPSSETPISPQSLSKQSTKPSSRPSSKHSEEKNCGHALRVRIGNHWNHDESIISTQCHESHFQFKVSLGAASFRRRTCTFDSKLNMHSSDNQLTYLSCFIKLFSRCLVLEIALSSSDGSIYGYQETTLLTP